MALFRITTPVAGFTGVSVGVNFTQGVAEVDSEAQGPALAYFRAQGYGVDPIDDLEPTPASTRKTTPKGAATS